MDTAQFTLKEVDTFADNSDEGASIDCTKTGYFYNTMRVKASNCFFETNYIDYKVYYYVRDWDESMHAKIKYIYNINSPSEFTYDIKNDFFSGDEFFMKIHFEDNEQQFDLPYIGFLLSKRNSVIEFEDLVLPCNDVKKISLIEDDLFSTEESSSIRFDCSRRGLGESVIKFGDDPNKGQYKVVYVIDKLPQGTKMYQKHEVFSPHDIELNKLNSIALAKKGQKAMIFKTMINAFNTNDLNLVDELSVSIYSDVVGDMFKCGEFKFQSGDIVDFKDLVVPCNEIVTVTLTEHDELFNDGHTVLIPCRPNSQ